jgi:hypothetical protein
MHTVGHALALKVWSLCVKWLPDCMRHLINPVLDAKDFKNAVEEERLMHKLVEERLMHKWVDEDYPEATDEQKANLVKLFKEV